MPGRFRNRASDGNQKNDSKELTELKVAPSSQLSIKNINQKHKTTVHSPSLNNDTDYLLQSSNSDIEVFQVPQNYIRPKVKRFRKRCDLDGNEKNDSATSFQSSNKNVKELKNKSKVDKTNSSVKTSQKQKTINPSSNLNNGTDYLLQSSNSDFEIVEMPSNYKRPKIQRFKKHSVSNDDFNADQTPICSSAQFCKEDNTQDLIKFETAVLPESCKNLLGKRRLDEVGNNCDNQNRFAMVKSPPNTSTMFLKSFIKNNGVNALNSTLQYPCRITNQKKRTNSLYLNKKSRTSSKMSRSLWTFAMFNSFCKKNKVSPPPTPLHKSISVSKDSDKNSKSPNNILKVRFNSFNRSRNSRKKIDNNPNCDILERHEVTCLDENQLNDNNIDNTKTKDNEAGTKSGSNRNLLSTRMHAVSDCKIYSLNSDKQTIKKEDVFQSGTALPKSQSVKLVQHINSKADQVKYNSYLPVLSPPTIENNSDKSKQITIYSAESIRETSQRKTTRRNTITRSQASTASSTNGVVFTSKMSQLDSSNVMHTHEVKILESLCGSSSEKRKCSPQCNKSKRSEFKSQRTIQSNTEIEKSDFDKAEVLGKEELSLLPSGLNTSHSSPEIQKSSITENVDSHDSVCASDVLNNDSNPVVSRIGNSRRSKSTPIQTNCVSKSVDLDVTRIDASNKKRSVSKMKNCKTSSCSSDVSIMIDLQKDCAEQTLNLGKNVNQNFEIDSASSVSDKNQKSAKNITTDNSGLSTSSVQECKSVSKSDDNLTNEMMKSKKLKCSMNKRKQDVPLKNSQNCSSASLFSDRKSGLNNNKNVEQVNKELDGTVHLTELANHENHSDGNIDKSSQEDCEVTRKSENHLEQKSSRGKYSLRNIKTASCLSDQFFSNQNVHMEIIRETTASSEGKSQLQFPDNNKNSLVTSPETDLFLCKSQTTSVPQVTSTYSGAKCSLKSRSSISHLRSKSIQNNKTLHKVNETHSVMTIKSIPTTRQTQKSNSKLLDVTNTSPLTSHAINSKLNTLKIPHSNLRQHSENNSDVLDKITSAHGSDEPCHLSQKYHCGYNEKQAGEPAGSQLFEPNSRKSKISFACQPSPLMVSFSTQTTPLPPRSKKRKFSDYNDGPFVDLSPILSCHDKTLTESDTPYTYAFEPDETSIKHYHEITLATDEVPQFTTPGPSNRVDCGLFINRVGLQDIARMAKYRDLNETIITDSPLIRPNNECVNLRRSKRNRIRKLAPNEFAIYSQDQTLTGIGIRPYPKGHYLDPHNHLNLPPKNKKFANYRIAFQKNKKKTTAK